MDDWDEEEFAAQLEIEAAMEMEAERWAAQEAAQEAAPAPAEGSPEAEAADVPIEVPDGIPKSDWDALQVLLSVAGNCWRSCGRTLYIYNDGIWTPESGATGPLFTALCTAHRERLGDRYGRSVYSINHLRVMALSANKVDKTWTQGFNQLPAGKVPFSNGIYDLETCQLRDYRPEDLLTEKFAFPAPTFADRYDAEYAEIKQIFVDMLPDEQLRFELMTRLAESLFNPKNVHKYFLQLYGLGNNGKTTLIRLLQTAFPIWVKMPDAAHMMVQSQGRDPSSPQPWLLDVMGARLLGFEEPPGNAKFDGSLLKLLRGNGLVSGRKCYGDVISYRPTYTMCFATNAPIEISPADDAVLNSMHSFEMPTFFKGPGDVIPLGISFVADKVPDLESRFEQRRYKLALLELLRDYWLGYRQAGNTLPDLCSKFSAQWARLYRESNPTLHEIFDRCIVVSSGTSTPQKNLFAAMRGSGGQATDTQLSHFMEKKFAKHPIVKKHRKKMGRMWEGLKLADTGNDYF